MLLDDVCRSSHELRRRKAASSWRVAAAKLHVTNADVRPHLAVAPPQCRLAVTMNKFLAVCTAVVLSSSCSLFAQGTNFLARVTGTVTTQETVTAGTSRIEVTPLTNKRIFDEFRVSTEDYALTMTPTGSLRLLPKSASSANPTITIISFTSTPIVLDTRRGIGRFVGRTSSATTANLFEGFVGHADGSFRFTQSTPPSNTQVTYTVSGAGDDLSADTPAILRFKLVSGRPFAQAP